VTGQAGTNMTAGQAAYLDTTTDPSQWQPCLSTSAVRSQVGGIVMNGVSSGQIANIAIAGDIYIGATLTVTNMITLGSGLGGLDVNAAQATTGWYPSLIGSMVGTTTCRLNITAGFGVTRTTVGTLGSNPMTITPSQVQMVTNPTNANTSGNVSNLPYFKNQPTLTVVGIAGQQINAGQSVYQSSTNPSTFSLANVTSATSAVLTGLAVNNALTNQDITVAVGGDVVITPASTADACDVVVLGSTNGNINSNQAGVGATWLPALMGIMISTTTVRLAITTNAGITHG
jgi:hypothetical protein